MVAKKSLKMQIQSTGRQESRLDQLEMCIFVKCPIFKPYNDYFWPKLRFWNAWDDNIIKKCDTRPLVRYQELLLTPSHVQGSKW